VRYRETRQQRGTEEILISRQQSGDGAGTAPHAKQPVLLWWPSQTGCGGVREDDVPAAGTSACSRLIAERRAQTLCVGSSSAEEACRAAVEHGAGHPRAESGPAATGGHCPARGHAVAPDGPALRR